MFASFIPHMLFLLMIGTYNSFRNILTSNTMKHSNYETRQFVVDDTLEYYNYFSNDAGDIHLVNDALNAFTYNSIEFNPLWSLELLTINYVENATNLVISANKGDKVLSTWKYNSFRKKVYDGFVSRCYRRLSSPSLRKTEESVIVAAFEKQPQLSLIGVVEVYPTKAPYLCNLAVASSARRKGLGRALCLTIENICVNAWNKSEITLQVERSNKGARAFYESLGYEAVANSNFFPTIESLFLGESHLVSYKKTLTPRQNCTNDGVELNSADILR